MSAGVKGQGRKVEGAFACGKGCEWRRGGFCCFPCNILLIRQGRLLCPEMTLCGVCLFLLILFVSWMGRCLLTLLSSR